MERESWLQRNGLYLAWVVSLIATGGSLYFSEVKGFIPCDLCWYQRIFMYPQALLLGMAAYRGDRRMANYLLPVSLIGGLISLYHNIEIWFPKLGEMAPCRSGIPCNQDYLNWLGFITIPLMALVAFILIAGLLIAARVRNR
ncbi:disulfide oxidoreductase [Paenibacillus sp. NPDC058071]|uniref:disulfide oxidoreductase n=1 Tax=Paenibacillus sp. NPDC058071 TaxID=3346326 RepID=UPI0036DE19C8